MSGTSDESDMKLEPITKLDRKKGATSKKLTMVSSHQTVTPLSFF